MKKCVKCGLKYGDDFSVCPDCGVPLVDLTAEATNTRTEEDSLKKEKAEERKRAMRLQLQSLTGCYIYDSAEALENTNYDINKAKEWLRKNKKIKKAKRLSLSGVIGALVLWAFSAFMIYLALCTSFGFRILASFGDGGFTASKVIFLVFAAIAAIVGFVSLLSKKE